MYLVTFVVELAFGGNLSFALLFLGADYTPLVIDGEVWRMVTSSFLHASLIHLLLNMYAFLMVGGYIEMFYGRKKLLVIYIITALCGSLFSLVVSFVSFWSTGGTSGMDSLSVGASGAIFGMIGVLIGSRFKKTPYEPQLGIDTGQLVNIVIYNLIIGISLNFIGGGSFINIWAHVGGLLGGLVLGVLLSGVNVFFIPKWKKILEMVLFVLSVILFVGSFIAEIVFIIVNTITI